MLHALQGASEGGTLVSSLLCRVFDSRKRVYFTGFVAGSRARSWSTFLDFLNAGAFE